MTKTDKSDLESIKDEFLRRRKKFAKKEKEILESTIKKIVSEIKPQKR